MYPNGENITVRELCQMRSGLLDAYNAPQYDKVTFTPQTAYTPQQLIATAVSNPPIFPPGTKWNYNTNYLMLGLIIEAVTHHPIQDEISTRLLAPLRLKRRPPSPPPIPTCRCCSPTATPSISRKLDRRDRQPLAQ